MEKKREQAILQKANITPSENALSMEHKNEAQQSLTTLQNARGRDFDREYVDVVIKDHNETIVLVDRILPEIKNTALKAEVLALRPRLEQHLRDAERVQHKMQTGTTAPQPTGAPKPHHGKPPKSH
jgi:putative membrane protein